MVSGYREEIQMPKIEPRRTRRIKTGCMFKKSSALNPKQVQMTEIQITKDIISPATGKHGSLPLEPRRTP